MRIEQALRLRIGSRVLAGDKIVRLIADPESNMWQGKVIARVTVADDLLRTCIYTHEEIDVQFDRAA